MGNRSITVRAALLLLGVLGATHVAPAVAQLPDTAGAVLVRDVDERGRAPYMQFRALLCDDAGTLTCDVSFAPVPEGYRLVLEHVNASVNLTGANVQRTALLAPGQFIFVLPSSAPSGEGLVIVNETVLAYFEGGQSPVFQVNLDVVGDAPLITAVVSGYLVSLDQ